MTVNGVAHVVSVEPRTLLVDVLRHELGLTGTHVGCEQGSCGACTVVVDGLAVRSCLMLAPQADGAAVDTVEGVGRRPRHPSRAARPARAPRAPVRLLHAGHRDGAGRGVEPGPATPRRPSERSSKVTCAGAPATSTSAPRCARPGRTAPMTSRAARGPSACPAWRTTGSCAAGGATSTTSSCPAFSTPPSSAAPSPTGSCAGSIARPSVGAGSVALVLGPEEVRARAAGLVPVVWVVPGQRDVGHPLVGDRVRYVGEPVGVVVAASRYYAEDALDRLYLETDELPAVVSPDGGAGAGRAAALPGLGDQRRRGAGERRYRRPHRRRVRRRRAGCCAPACAWVAWRARRWSRGASSPSPTPAPAS